MYENNAHINYSAADIRRYLNGEMNRDEMYALEKQAAEDPFLADAIEGYTGITIEAAEADLALLRSKLKKAEDPEEAKVVPMKTPGGFKWWKQGIAAAVAALVIFAAVMFLGDKKDKPEALAVNTAPEQTQIKPAPGSPKPIPVDPIKETNTGAFRNDAAKQVFISPDSSSKITLKGTRANDLAAAGMDIKPAAGSPGAAYYYKPEESAKFKSAVTDSIIQKNVNEGVAWADEDQKKEQSRAVAPPPVIADKSQPAQMENVIARQNRAVENMNDRRRSNNTGSVENFGEVVTTGRKEDRSKKQSNGFERDFDGSMNEQKRPGILNPSHNYSFNYRVTDVNGNSIPFSNITVPGQLTTYSRADGTFGLLSEDSLLRINIKSLGYEPKTFLLQYNAQTANIVLNPESLSKDKDLVIVGDQKNFAMRKQKAKEKEAEEVEPLDGWATYDSYLANNIDLSDKAKGEVELSIEVNKKGEIKNVTVEKSLGAKEDQEAIRLITQGPKWKGKKKKSKAKVVVTF